MFKVRHGCAFSGLRKRCFGESFSICYICDICKTGKYAKIVPVICLNNIYTFYIKRHIIITL